MREISALTRRNVKLFFKDKGTFFTSLITPAILLVLYATFLSNVYKESFMENLVPLYQLLLMDKQYMFLVSMDIQLF